MKVVILAGGLGTRLSEETQVKPKPMVEVGGKPILWHIMKIYSAFGINDFVVALGYKGYMIKEYFANYSLHSADVTFDLAERNVEYHNDGPDPWRVTLVDTGDQTLTGGRLKRVAPYLDNETFCMTYGDGVSDINIGKLIEFHRATALKATVSAVQPPGRFGSLELNSEKVSSFIEKPAGDGGWINAGFFVLEPTVIDYIDNDSTPWENQPLEKLAAEKQLAAYKHSGFWHAMDTLRDCKQLNSLWETGNPPWMLWQKESRVKRKRHVEFDFTPQKNGQSKIAEQT